MTKELATVILGLCVTFIIVLAIIMGRIMNVGQLDKQEREHIYQEYDRAGTWDKRLLVYVMLLVRIFLTGYWGVVLAAISTLGGMVTVLNGWFELDKLRPLLRDFYELIRDILRPSSVSAGTPTPRSG